MGFFILFILIGAMETYLFFAFRQAFSDSIWQKIGYGYVIFSVLIVAAAMFRASIVYRQGYGYADLYTNLLMGTMMTVFITNLVLIFFFFSEDIFRILHYLWQLLPFGDRTAPKFAGRRQFIGQMAALAASIPFAGLLYGTFKGKYDFKVFRQKLTFGDLPSSFEGFKMVQISDVHSGSFDSVEAVERAVQMIQDQQPDLVVFTGDWVNNFADELLPYLSIFKKLKPPFGKFSVWGNHDYHAAGMTAEAHRERMRHHVEEMGFQVLENSNVKIEKGGDFIRLFGVENWGKPPFPQFGDLGKAKEGSEKGDFSILLSHDPTHWDAKVLTDDHLFHLTLSGHTHGAQMGIEAKWLRWSPSKFIYPRWAGLYEEAGRYLYVNRGFGFLGYPGRVGIRPEIAVLELKKGDS